MDIENTLKIMLKGAAGHTEKEEIIEKLKSVEKENRPLAVESGMFQYIQRNKV